MLAPLQLVLDFLTPRPAALPAAPPVARPAQGPERAQVPAPPPPSQPSPQLGGFVHRQANRQAQLQGVAVGYVLTRSRRRSVGFVVGPEGLQVRAPMWVTLRDVDAAVQDKAKWIVSKLQLLQQRQTQHVRQAVVWAHGHSVPYLGRSLRICVHAAGQPQTQTQTQTQTNAQLQPTAQDPAATDTLTLHLPPGASATQVREAAQAWLQKQALALFAQRLDHFAPQLGVRHTRLSLSAATTRWGSATSGGHIRLNWRLIHQPMAQIDYVVVHELAHLREMNHSPRFWQTVGSVMPDYGERRKQLRGQGSVLTADLDLDTDAPEAPSAGA